MKQSSCLFLCVTSRLSLIPCNNFLTLLSHVWCNKPPVSLFLFVTILLSLFLRKKSSIHLMWNNFPVSLLCCKPPVSLCMYNPPVCTMYSNLSVSLFLQQLVLFSLYAATCLFLSFCSNLYFSLFMQQLVLLFLYAATCLLLSLYSNLSFSLFMHQLVFLSL